MQCRHLLSVPPKLFLLCLLSVLPFQAASGVQSSLPLLELCGKAADIEIDVQHPVAILIDDKPKGRALHMKLGWRPLGITYFSNATDLAIEWEKYISKTTSCIRVNKIKINIGMISPRIWLSQDVRINRCLKGIVMQHELTHVSNRQKYNVDLKFQILKLLEQENEIRFFHLFEDIHQEIKLRQSTEDSIATAIHIAKKQSLKKLKIVDSDLDDPQNYMKTLRLCDI